MLPSPAPARQVLGMCLLCLCDARASFQAAVDQDARSAPYSLSSASPLWVCPRCDQSVARGTCSGLLCAVPAPPHPVSLSAPGVRRTPSREHITARRWHPWKVKRQREPCRAGRHVTRSSCVHAELVSPWNLCVHVKLLCPHGACVPTRSSSPAGAPTLGAWKHMSGSPSGHLCWPRENSRRNQN